MDKDTTDKKALVDRLTTEQESTKTNKYRQVLRKKVGEDDFEIHEYKDPKGNIGYQIIAYKVVDGKEYVMSKGVGVESEYRSHDWVEVTKE